MSGCKQRENLIFIRNRLLYLVILVGNKFLDKTNFTPDFYKKLKKDKNIKSFNKTWKFLPKMRGKVPNSN